MTETIETINKPYTKPVYRQIASAFDAMLRCEKEGNAVWRIRHGARIEKICDEGPRGSGIDCGVKFDFAASKPERLVFNTSFHHMDDHGYYDGWTEHDVIVTPSLQFGLSIRITGRDRNEIKDHLHEVFNHWLNEEKELS